MHMGKSIITCLVLVAVALLGACSDRSDHTAVLKQYPLDSLDSIGSIEGGRFDPDISSDGRGALHIKASTGTTVKLFETGDLDVENTQLIYQAKIRTEGVNGTVYLEMWCSFPGKGEFFSRALHGPLSGTNDWVSQATPFFLKQGENPDNVKLNLVIDGTGDVWIDDIKLLTAPLK
ncbi:MAG: hypothetical protein ABW116_04265 [Candidatus Sedimenticola sp. 20ELBAFRAG]